MKRTIAAAALAACALQPALAQEVRLTPDLPEKTLTLNGERVTIAREPDPGHRLAGEFTKTSRDCPPFCIHAMEAAPGVETVGELELISFLEAHVEPGTGLLIDSRVPAWFEKGTIPGAVNVPFSTLEPSNPYRDEILKALGARETGSRLSFDEAMDILLFCNGPWCDQSPRAIRNLIDAGYPAGKIRYYRGGMQLWLLLGLTVVTPQTQG